MGIFCKYIKNNILYNNKINLPLFIVFCLVISVTIIDKSFMTYPYPNRIKDEINYNFTPDSGGYTYFFPRFFFQPWETVRSPGYPLFLKFFLYGTLTQQKKVLDEAKKYNSEQLFGKGEINRLFKTYGLKTRLNEVVATQLALTIASVLALYFALLAPMSKFNLLEILFLGFSFVWILNYFPLMPIREIMTESLAVPVLFLFAVFIVFYNKFGLPMYLALASFFASYAFLIRPACGTILVLATVYVFFYIFKTKNIKRYIWSIISLLPAFIYICWISIQGGTLIFGTLGSINNILLYSYVVEEKDLENMPTQRANDFTQLFLPEKHKYDSEHVNKKDGLNYGTTVTAYMWGGPINRAYTGFNRLYPDFNASKLLENLSLGKELLAGVQKNHYWEIWLIRLQSTLISLGLDSAIPATRFHRIFSYHYILPSLLIWLIVLYLYPEKRLSLFNLVTMHFFSVIAAAFANGVNARYIVLTEFFMIMGFLYSWFLFFLYILKNLIYKLSIRVYSNGAKMAQKTASIK